MPKSEAKNTPGGLERVNKNTHAETAESYNEKLRELNLKNIRDFFKNPKIKNTLKNAAEGYADKDASGNYLNKGPKMPFEKIIKLPDVEQIFKMYKNSDDYGKLYIERQIKDMVNNESDDYNSDFIGGLFYGDYPGHESFNNMGRPNTSEMRTKRNKEVADDFINGKLQLQLVDEFTADAGADKKKGTITVRTSYGKKREAEYSNLIGIIELVNPNRKIAVDGLKSRTTVENGQTDVTVYEVPGLENDGWSDNRIKYYKADPAIVDPIEFIIK